jgi:hypothetical protein
MWYKDVDPFLELVADRRIVAALSQQWGESLSYLPLPLEPPHTGASHDPNAAVER